MKLSTRSRYGARILLEIARHKNSESVQASEISRHESIPVKYVEQLIRILKSARLISSVRGPKGGYFIAREPNKITLGEIVRLFEGHPELVACISDPDVCKAAEECRIRLAWKQATDALYQKLDSVTIADLMDQEAAYKGLCQKERR